MLGLFNDDPNPYSPPVAGESRWSPPPPPADSDRPPSQAPLVFGVLSIIFASLMGLGSLFGSCGACSMGGLDAQVEGLTSRQAGPQVDAIKAYMHQMRLAAVVGSLESLVFLAMSGFLLALGIGQVGYRRWAARHTPLWAFVALVVLGLMCLVSVFVLGPIYRNAVTSMGRQLGPGVDMLPAAAGWTSTVFAGTSIAMMVFLFAPYPVLLLAFFSRPAVRAAMTR
jgi:hypothetical protein